MSECVKPAIGYDIVRNQVYYEKSLTRIRMKSEEKINKWDILMIGTWNVRGFCQLGNRPIMEKEITNRKKGRDTAL